MKKKTTRFSLSPARPQPRPAEPLAGLRAFAWRIGDAVISFLSWTPSERVPFPLALFLVLAPVVYAMIIPGGWFPGRRAVEFPAAVREPAIDAPQTVAPGVAAQVRAGGGEDPFRRVFDAMTADVEASARRYPHRVGIYIKDLHHNLEWSYHADDLFPAASLIKVPVMCGVFEKIHRGELSLNSQLTLRRRTRMGGSGSLKWAREGSSYTVRRLLEKLIHESDNSAMMLLIDEVGMGYLQRFFPSMGLVYTEIYPDGLRLTSGSVRYENYTTPREMGGMFEKMYRHQMVDQFASELMLDILKSNPSRSRLAKELPVGWELAHKTGLLRRACHDVGIVFSPQGDYVIAVLTGRNQSYTAAKDLIINLGKTTYKYYRQDSGLFVKARSAAPVE